MVLPFFFNLLSSLIQGLQLDNRNSVVESVSLRAKRKVSPVGWWMSHVSPVNDVEGSSR